MPPSSIASRNTFRDDREAPLCARDARLSASDLPDGASGENAASGLTTPNVLEQTSKISFWARTNLALPRAPSEAHRANFDHETLLAVAIRDLASSHFLVH
jgi:hypothetical protein